MKFKLNWASFENQEIEANKTFSAAYVEAFFPLIIV